ncbi:hypothetical protein RKD55_003583 [Rossellomorea marisflavi]
MGENLIVKSNQQWIRYAVRTQQDTSLSFQQ